MINEKTVMEAYLYLQELNNTIPDETLDFMRDVSLNELNRINDEKAQKKAQNTKILTIDKLKTVGKYTEYWFKEITNYNERFTFCSKTHQLYDIVQRDCKLSTHVLNNGFIGLKTVWKFDENNWIIDNIYLEQS